MLALAVAHTTPQSCTHLDTNSCNSGSRFSGSSTEYSSCMCDDVSAPSSHKHATAFAAVQAYLCRVSSSHLLLSATDMDIV
jgi:hypothetical protein